MGASRFSRRARRIPQATSSRLVAPYPLLSLGIIDRALQLAFQPRFRRADGHALVDELADQIFVVAKGASAKFRWIRWTVSALFWIQLRGLALFAAIKIPG